jgi:hypothetical protein
MREVREMLRERPLTHFSLIGEEYDAVMREVERRLRAELKAEAVVG